MEKRRRVWKGCWWGLWKSGKDRATVEFSPEATVVVGAPRFNAHLQMFGYVVRCEKRSGVEKVGPPPQVIALKGFHQKRRLGTHGEIAAKAAADRLNASLFRGDARAQKGLKGVNWGPGCVHARRGFTVFGLMEIGKTQHC